MKLISLSEKILKFMVHEYADRGTQCFSFETMLKEFPGYDNVFLSNAIYLLQKDGFVSVTDGDDVAYVTNLLPEGIRNREEDTLLKKGYTILKEIKTLLS